MSGASSAMRQVTALGSGAPKHGLWAPHLAVALICVSTAALAQPAEVPDDTLSPGAVATSDRDIICGHTDGLSYSREHRHTPSELKREIDREYGDFTGDREVDHRVPLCLGGADEKANLWLQPGDGQAVEWTYHDKDRLEVASCHLVCRGSVSVATAQAWFLAPADWRISYCRLFSDDRRCTR